MKNRTSIPCSCTSLLIGVVSACAMWAGVAWLVGLLARLI